MKYNSILFVSLIIILPVTVTLFFQHGFVNIPDYLASDYNIYHDDGGWGLNAFNSWWMSGFNNYFLEIFKIFFGVIGNLVSVFFGSLGTVATWFNEIWDTLKDIGTWFLGEL